MCELSEKGKTKKVALLLALFLWLPVISSATDFGDNLRLNGFYGVSLNLTDSQGVTLPTASRTPIELEEGELNTDYSVLGLQADYAFTNNFSLTLQGIASKQSRGTYSPTLEWGYLTYDLGDDLSIRAGKFKLPFLQGMELHHVGFSRLWVRPLSPGSGAGGFTEYRGAEVIKGTQLGDYNISFQGAFGKAEHHQTAVDNDHVKLFATRIEKDDSWLRLALFNAKYDVPVDPRRTVWGAEKVMASIEAELLHDNYTLNMGYVYGDAEASPDDSLAYLSLGYRVGRFTPYALYQYRLMEHDASELRPPAGGPPRPPGAPVRSFPDGDFEINSYSIGFRYDIGPTYAIKVEWEHRVTRDDTDPLLEVQKGEANIYTIVFESVF